MGRHADPTATRRRVTLPLLVAAGIVVLLVAGGLVWWLAGRGDACETREAVAVTVAPEFEPVAAELLAAPIELAGGLCAEAEVTAQQPLQTIGDLAALEDDALPALWVPDSSLWPARAGDTVLETVGSAATSPVVLATSSAAVEALGWGATPPGWAQALAGGQPLAVPDLATSAEGLAALSAVRTALGGDADADNAVVQAVLAAQRGAAVPAADALAAGRDGGADAPLVPVSEQEVYSLNQATDQDGGSSLVAVYPAEGSPALDYPVVRVGAPSGDAATAVDAVARRLTSDAARSAALAAGFRDADGSAPADADAAGIRSTAPTALPLDPAGVQALLGRLSSLASPSRILAVFDVSTSMEAPVGNGTRATLARDAAKATLALVPGDYALGLWVFAYQLANGQDWTELVPTQELDADAGGRLQRDVLDSQLDTIPERLTPGGTGLYDTTLAAVRAAREDFDPTAVNSVLVLTDGTNEDDEAGLQLDALLQALRSEANPERPIKVIGVALGPDADLAALEQIAAATAGAAYSAVDPADLQTVLFDALRQRG
jgi:hypothetical protein